MKLHSDNNEASSRAGHVQGTDPPSEKRTVPNQNGFELDRAVKPAVFIIVATVVLWFGKEILLPLAVAATLALISSPIANRLQHFLGRLVSTALVVVATLAAVTVIGYLVSSELTSVALELTAYSNNIASKLSAFQKETPAWFARIEASVKNIEKQVEHSNRRHKRERPVILTSAGSSLQKMLKPALPVLGGVVEALLVVPLLFFLLYERKALRARFVRLAARARMIIAAEAIDAASEAVSHYLFLYALVNLVFGAAIGLVTFLFGLPQPWFWGLLAFLLRFIPYVGAFASALLPAAVAFAIFPGWAASLGILGSFLLLDQLLAQFVEPILIGLLYFW